MNCGSSHSIPDLPAAQLFLASFDHLAVRRGRGLVSARAVTRLTGDPNGTAFLGEVAVGAIFRVRLTYDSGDWASDCSCLVKQRCKHAYAVMTALLKGEPELSPPTEEERKALGGGAVTLADQLAAKLGRPLKLAEWDFTMKVQGLYERTKRHSALSVWDLEFLGFRRSELGYGEFKFWPKPPQDALEFWLFLAHGLRERGIPLPAFLEPISDTSRIQPLLDDWERQAEIERWQGLLRQLEASPAAGPAFTLDFRLRLNATTVALESRLPSEPEFSPIKTNRFRQLLQEHQAGRMEAVSAAFPVWDAYTGHFGFYGSAEARLHNNETSHMLSRLFRLAGLEARLVNEQGQPFARPEQRLSWSLAAAQSETEDYELRLVLPDGQPAPPIWTTLRGAPTLYVCPAAVYSGPPAVGDHLDPRQPNRIPAPAFESAPGLSLLRRLDIPLPPRLASRVRTLKMPVRFVCSLAPLYAGSPSEGFFVQVLSDLPEMPARESLSDRGWEPGPERRARNRGKDLLFLFDRSLLDLAPHHLQQLGVLWDGAQGKWRQRITKNFADRILAWLQTLPKEFEVSLQGELASLAADPVEARVRLGCTEATVDWFDLAVELEVSDAALSPEEIKALLDAQGRYVRLRGKGWRRLQLNLSEEENHQLARLGLSPHDFSSEPQRLHALQLADEAAAALLPQQQVEQVRRRVDELKARVTPPLPQTIQAQLRPYQVEGFNFLAYLTTNRFGGILADDMGLGKTVQALTWLAWLRADGGGSGKASLVVCPKSVMENWRVEAGRFFPSLRVRLWRGADPEALTAALTDTDLLVLNYTQMRLLTPGLSAVGFHAVILDEGQCIKNPDSQTARAAFSLQAEQRLALSGTPIENRLLDLWSIMFFAMPGVLGNRTRFLRRFNQNGDPLARRRLAARVRPFVLRRTKGQVAQDLPDRVEEDIICEMEGRQRLLYNAEYKRARQILLAIRTSQELNDQRFHFLTSLLRLRQICCDPRLYDPATPGGESAKLHALLELLDPLIAEGHKVLVFSQFVTMLDLLREMIELKGWPHFYLAGDTEDRGDLVASFQAAEGAAVFLISLKAGGFGLNLTAASYVVLYDPWWNPAVENQAIDRTHRIGQANKVIAYRLLIKESIEEKIRQLQRQKNALAQDVLGDDSFAQSLTLDDLQFLFSEDRE